MGVLGGYSPAPLLLFLGSVPHDLPHARGGKVSGGSDPHEQQYERSGGLNHMTTGMLEEERSPWG